MFWYCHGISLNTFCLYWNVSFFLTLVTKADGDLQVSPDVGTSPDASDTGFEELMDVSDGKRDFTFGLFLGKWLDQGFIIKFWSFI